MIEIITILSCLIFIETTFLIIRLFKKSFNYYGQKRKIYVDTSSLMDGRILKVAKTGFLGGVYSDRKSVV